MQVCGSNKSLAQYSHQKKKSLSPNFANQCFVSCGSGQRNQITQDPVSRSVHSFYHCINSKDALEELVTIATERLAVVNKFVQDNHDNALELSKVSKWAISEENSGERRYEENRIALLANQ